MKNLLISGVSLRRISRLLRISRATATRKLLHLSEIAKKERLAYLESLSKTSSLLSEFYFDEMETFERSKCLPLSIPIAVLPGERKILSFRVAQMPAKGLLAGISRKKYGFRKDFRPEAAASLFAEIKSAIAPNVKIKTDQNPHYPNWLRKPFPKFSHTQVKGRRGCVVGQGELKRGGFDPLFALNHTCAMIRANVNRLFRRTWNTTKRPDRLLAHLEVYAHYHNTVLT